MGLVKPPKECLVCLNSNETKFVLTEESQKIFKVCCSYVKDAINIDFLINNINENNNQLSFCKNCLNSSLSLSKLVEQLSQLKKEIDQLSSSFAETIAQQRIQVTANAFKKQFNNRNKNVHSTNDQIENSKSSDRLLLHGLSSDSNTDSFVHSDASNDSIVEQIATDEICGENVKAESNDIFVEYEDGSCNDNTEQEYEMQYLVTENENDPLGEMELEPISGSVSSVTMSNRALKRTRSVVPSSSSTFTSPRNSYEDKSGVDKNLLSTVGSCSSCRSTTETTNSKHKNPNFEIDTASEVGNHIMASYVCPSTICPSSKRQKLVIPDVRQILLENFPEINIGCVNKLPTKQQNAVLRFLVGKLAVQCGFYPSFEIQEQFAEKICELLPNIIKSALFNRVPGRVLSGYIPERLKYIRPDDVKSKRKRNFTDAVSSNVRSEPPGVDEEDMKQKLKLTHHSNDELKVLMEKTFLLRRKEADDLDANLETFLQDWPRLTDSDGIIDNDFARLHPNCEDFTLSWRKASQNVIKYAEQKNMNWMELFGITKEELTSDDEAIVALLLLPHLIQGGFKYNTTKGKKTTCKLSAVDARNFFIQILKYGSSMEEFLEQKNLPSQPFVVSVGNLPTLNFQKHFFMIERRLVKGISMVQAVDLCLKSFILCRIGFPTECRQVWNFLGCAIYGLVNEKELTSSGKALKDFCS